MVKLIKGQKAKDNSIRAKKQKNYIRIEDKKIIIIVIKSKTIKTKVKVKKIVHYIIQIRTSDFCRCNYILIFITSCDLAPIEKCSQSYFLLWWIFFLSNRF